MSIRAIRQKNSLKNVHYAFLFYWHRNAIRFLFHIRQPDGFLWFLRLQ